MKAAEIPAAYDALLQQLIHDQDKSMIMPPFLLPHVVVIKALARRRTKAGQTEERERVLGRKQPNILRSSFAGVQKILQRLEEYSISDLQALKICHEANYRRMKKKFRVGGIFFSTGTTLAARLGAPIHPGIFQGKEFQEILFYVCVFAGTYTFLIWITSPAMLGRLEVFSDLLEIVLQKKNGVPEPAP